MQKDYVRKHAGPAPRYTSYPTAPHFHAGVDGDVYARWLRQLKPGQTLSLYIHIPWCDRLCWFCGCNTKQTRRYDPLKTYLAALENEIETISGLVDPGCRVTALHLGGGSPTMLKPEDMVWLDKALRSRFHFDDGAEISVEMDPNDLDADKYDALAEIGLTRASIGVQDFDEKVQQAINREQTFEQTREVVEQVRARGVRSVNCDVLYGLPHQTRQSVDRTIEQVVSLRPDRIALFGYAHVPWMKTHQKMIDEAALPDVTERFAQMNRASSSLTAAGYTSIGIDHFALPADSLAIAAASGAMRRNFQGYTSDTADALIGMGASSIGQLPQGYIQNQPSTGEYQRQVNLGRLPVVRGFELSEEDRLRARIIELLMCDFAFSFSTIRHEFGGAAEQVLDEAEYLAGCDTDGMIEFSGGLFQVTDKGRPFVRSIASAFDSYFGEGAARHSLAV
ncbi:oxygen-independent coproporphyrinogen III oxidase [Hoeflea phototrophica DFL-43]|jgi:oxygen-independent coproporphyrinogen-3 oxidase|uniref:Coproporphyrinogen-III oxidase n=1 Tax=Hoeflea phototrophica (strain DSM 17068 / NCIMB 14078 / DFL-43) TaxID=411684 RepID=A9DHL9_HOEPD|nr:oxygen-independent coproporphyrinogen III oxidase [Hoeflea phototrophica]EDQ31456.1 oxygen-independent coproporphyrinogen III oxidase [Hoeflea phototrophica DFL-43]